MCAAELITRATPPQVVKALHEIFKDIKPACGKRGKDEKEVKRTLTRSIAYDRSIFPVDASKNDTLLVPPPSTAGACMRRCCARLTRRLIADEMLDC